MFDIMTDVGVNRNYNFSKYDINTFDGDTMLQGLSKDLIDKAWEKYQDFKTNKTKYFVKVGVHKYAVIKHIATIVAFGGDSSDGFFDVPGWAASWKLLLVRGVSVQMFAFLYNVYKTDGIVPHQAKREVAKSMVLMEATDDIFSKTLQILNQANEPSKALLSSLKTLFQQLIGSPNTDIRTNMVISLPTKEDLDGFFKNSQYLIPSIKDRQSVFSFSSLSS